MNDPYVAEARRLGYRSRAAFKLIELDERFRLLRPGQRAADLGCAPGGWTQVAVARVGRHGIVVGIDLAETAPLPGATFLRVEVTLVLAGLWTIPAGVYIGTHPRAARLLLVDRCDTGPDGIQCLG